MVTECVLISVSPNARTHPHRENTWDDPISQLEIDHMVVAAVGVTAAAEVVVIVVVVLAVVVTVGVDTVTEGHDHAQDLDHHTTEIVIDRCSSLLSDINEEIFLKWKLSYSEDEIVAIQCSWTT